MHLQLGLERFFDAGSIAKGIAYARESRIAELSDLSPDGHLTAEVRGSGRQAYGVDMRLTFGPDLRLIKVTGVCGCPVGLFCKHMVAALIAWQVRGTRGSAALPKDVETARRQPARPLPYSVTEWLDALTAASRIPSGPASDYPPAVRDRLVYVLGVTAGKPTITAMKATVQADGSVSDRATRYDVERLKRQENRPQFILRKDLEILRDLEADGVPVNAGAHSSHFWRPKFLEDGPPDFLPILRRIAATGRGRWKDRNGTFLHEEGPRRAEFAWLGEEGGTRELRLVCAATGTSLIALPFATPAWLDPATGGFGLLETSMEPRQLHILIRAPKIPAEIAAEVAARLSGFSGQSVPVPKVIGIELRQGSDPYMDVMHSVTELRFRFQRIDEFRQFLFREDPPSFFALDPLNHFGKHFSADRPDLAMPVQHDLSVEQPCRRPERDDNFGHLVSWSGIVVEIMRCIHFFHAVSALTTDRLVPRRSRGVRADRWVAWE